MKYDDRANDTLVAEARACFHCGDACREVLWANDKPFCCEGCRMVFEILNENNLCEYYSLDGHAGLSQKHAGTQGFEFLDSPDVRPRLLLFDSQQLAKVSFSVPAVHCASCIWLLENLRKLNAGVLRAEVSFGRKTVDIDFDPRKTSLSQLAALMASIGYAPVVNLDNKPAADAGNALVYKLAIAGFCFGNVMLFSFPEYLGLDAAQGNLKTIFAWLNLALAVPVFFYSAADYFASAARSFRQRMINIDVPIAAGLLALFARSTYDILSATGPGYLDSFTGLVFFLLIGRWFQGKTYESLAFDRDFTSYFPLAVNRWAGDAWKPVVIYELDAGDTIRIRNMEIVPADAVLNDAHAYFDYSFVTGESKPTRVLQGDRVFAGGRLVGQPVTLRVQKKTSQSHLTSLWNNEAFRKVEESKYQKIIDRAARKFTCVVMALAVITAVVWYVYKPADMWLVLTSVLMVACPCALALAAPFTFGSMLRVFGKNNLYLKNADVIERMAGIDAVVFDKTGTVTHGSEPQVDFTGALSDAEWSAVKLLTGASTHPLSAVVAKAIAARPAETLTEFKELPGKGVQAMIGGVRVQVGSAAFVNAAPPATAGSACVFVAVEGAVRGYFRIRVKTRTNMKGMLNRLGAKCVALLSGDNEGDRAAMEALFRPTVQLLFNQDPHNKMAFIRDLQAAGRKVMMVGDGLNDSGALKQSDVGIAITDDAGVFTPACDGILDGKQLLQLDRFLRLARYASAILRVAFGISFFYNTIALGFAVTGHLTPLVAAVLMPVSSISVVSFSTLAVKYAARRVLIKQ